MKKGYATLPLHPGKAPPWLFKRMVRLAESIVDAFVLEFSAEEFLRRISDPFWFQAFSCVLGFDWHSSGTTTVTCGALKEAINPKAHDLGLAVAGGKGKVSRKVPLEIRKFGGDFGIDSVNLEYASRMAAKVDSAAVQDGHQLYHHVLIFTEKGKWAVIQQGMFEAMGTARRYHWLSDDIISFVEEPHKGILGERMDAVLDMTSDQSREARKIALDLVKDNPQHLKSDWARLIRPEAPLEKWLGLAVKKYPHLEMPRNIDWEAMKRLYDFQPRNYEQIISEKGIGPATVRALALISELIYSSPPSWKDPVKYTFTVGGKDGVPYPVDRYTMDKTIEVLNEGIQQARLDKWERMDAIRRLRNIVPE